jgi:hypothetical protein
MNLNKPHFSSLSELLEHTRDKPFDEAYSVAKAEFAIASDCVERIQRVPKAKRSQAQWNLIDYFDILRVLLNAMEGHWMPDGEKPHTRKLIQEALKKWGRK